MFVSDGIAAAVETARGLAGERNVGLNAGTIASQALDAGLVDEVWVDLVPVVLGGGTPFFQTWLVPRSLLDGPIVEQSNRVTHLRYTVRLVARPADPGQHADVRVVGEQAVRYRPAGTSPARRRDHRGNTDRQCGPIGNCAAPDR